MPGFLDSHAPSIKAEYTRFLNPDILGKIILKNFALNVLGLPADYIRTPLSRHGDLGTYKDSVDANIRFKNRWYEVETKFSHHVVAKRCKTRPYPRWLFSRALRSGRKDGNPYDLLFGIGLNLPGMEDSIGFWKELEALKYSHEAEGRQFDVDAAPHEPAFLARCGIFILPRNTIRVNQIDITIGTLSRRPEYNFFAWGYDSSGLLRVWESATKMVRAND